MRVSGTVLIFALVGCASGGGTPETATAGAPDAPPSMECLPGVGSEARTDFSQSMTFAWRLSEDAFELADPVAPSAGADTATVQAWTDGPLLEWLNQKNRLVEAARSELNLAAEESHDQRTMAGALVGLLYEDVARVLLDVPLPRDLRNEERIVVEAFEDVVESQARPYIEHAKRAFRACAANAEPHEHLHAWAHFCSARAANLPVLRSAREAEGTTVEVIAPE
jgi:hypothetical protein